VVVEALRRGVLLLGGGLHGNVLSLSPPYVITEEQSEFAIGVIRECVEAL
jgi:4-aminobutyrate aminotransferase-like enzyme